ncbi:ABC transporter ATP-binding protein [Streptomyces sp. NPDC058335]|uniref:ABC transporter ATP-binding protein n=1 Tax=Streptomyces sp. NPDC058335 TaxID=3346451 RepID=UPI00364652E1
MHGVSRKYGAGPPALDDVTLSVRAGEALAVVGPSGSGKSTLLNLIAGLDRPSAGSVTVGGVRVDELNETGSARYRRDRIGMVFQFFNLLDDLTVHDNVLLPAQLAGMPRAEARARAAELLWHLGVERHAGAYPGRLSGGERQRVAVARALMNRPALLLADEPTGALDTASGEQVRELLTGLNADGQTIVLVTHDLVLARSCATRTVELVDGRVARDSGSVPGHRPAVSP